MASNRLSWCMLPCYELMTIGIVLLTMNGVKCSVYKSWETQSVRYSQLSCVRQNDWCNVRMQFWYWTMITQSLKKYDPLMMYCLLTNDMRHKKQAEVSLVSPQTLFIVSWTLWQWVISVAVSIASIKRGVVKPFRFGCALPTAHCLVATFESCWSHGLLCKGRSYQFQRPPTFNWVGVTGLP